MINAESNLFDKLEGITMVEGWIFDDNLPAFLTTLGEIVGYEFGNDEKAAISQEAADSDRDKNRYYVHELIGSDYPATIQLAWDRGCGVLLIWVEVPPELEPQLRVAISIFNAYHVTRTPDHRRKSR